LTLCAFAVKPRWGKIIAPSYYAKHEPFEIGGYLMRKAPQFRPVHPAYSRDKLDDLRRGIWALGAGLLPMDRLITHRFKLEDLHEAFEVAARKEPDFIKGVVVP